MMRSTEYLRRFIREALLLREGADEDLAALYEDAADWGVKAITLYSPARLLEDPGNPSAAVVGYIMAQRPESPCAGAWEVKMSGGRGYGWSVLYPAMFAAVGGPLMPDRKTVSPAAEKRWATKATGRGKTPLDKVGAPEEEKLTPDDPSDDCDVRSWKLDPVSGRWGGDPVLDAAYRPRGDEKALFDRLLRRHEETMGEVTGAGHDRSDVEAGLSRGGGEKFNAELYGK